MCTYVYTYIYIYIYIYIHIRAWRQGLRVGGGVRDAWEPEMLV